MELLPQLFTVGDLVDALEGIDQDTPVSVTGPDFGGYDYEWQPYCTINHYDGRVFITHLAADAYQMYVAGKINKDVRDLYDAAT